MLCVKGVALFHVVRTYELEGAVCNDSGQDMLDPEPACRDCLDRRFQQRHLHPIDPGAASSAIGCAVRLEMNPASLGVAQIAATIALSYWTHSNKVLGRLNPKQQNNLL